MADTNGAVDALVDRASRGELVLFIGNDAPEQETGRPNAQDLAQGLSRKWKEVAASNLAAAAKGLQQWQIRAYLDQALPQDSEPGPLLRTIAQLPVPFLVSAAFDILLERALKDAGRSASRLIDDRDLEQRRHGQPDLIKVAGDLRRPASLIVTDERYRAMPDKRRYQLFSLLEAWLVEKSLLFIGCDPAVDGDFEQRIFPLLTRNLSLSDLDAYLVWPDLSPTESELWRQQNVTFVDDQPQEFLESLANLLDGTIVSFADDPEMIALKAFLKRLKGAQKNVPTNSQLQKVPLNQWLTAIRITLGLRVLNNKNQTLGATIRVDFDPDIDHFASEGARDTGITMKQLQGWATRAETARDSGSVMSGSRWRSVEASGIKFLNAILPEDSPERRYYLQALYLRQTFADALSMVIEVEDDRLSPIPWELLHDGELSWDDMKLGRGLWGLQYPVYRRPKSPSSPEQVRGQIEKALIIAADPTGQLAALDEEVDWLRDMLEKAGVVQVDVLRADDPEISQPETIKALLRDGGYQLLHFTGHGIHDPADPSQSRLLLGRRRERNKALSATALGQVARNKHLVLVFLSACNVGVTEESVRGRPWDEAGIVDAFTRAGVPAAIGMRWKIGEQNARTMTETFYEELSKGTPIEQALMFARQAVDMPADEDLVDWANPILTKRHGVLST